MRCLCSFVALSCAIVLVTIIVHSTINAMILGFPQIALTGATNVKGWYMYFFITAVYCCFLDLQFDTIIILYALCPPICSLRSLAVAPSSKFSPFRMAFLPKRCLMANWAS